jgi:hypothetical protein
VLLVLNFSIEPVMDYIIEPNKQFDFSQLSLANPTGIQGGAYFTKILNNTKPLYIQTTKSLTRQGFVKTGKKYYCDLMFDNNSEILINWFENLEERCQQLIYEKSEAWFQNTLEKTDVETAFNSIIRVYKSGKFYLVRTNVKNSSLNEPSIKIYNENEVSLGINDITTQTNIISILEIQGIKFTSRNFQIEIELKQIMVLNDEPIFESCLFNKTKKNTEQPLVSFDVTHLEKTNNNEIDELSQEIDKLEELEELDEINNEKQQESLDNLNNSLVDSSLTKEPDPEPEPNLLDLKIEELEELEDVDNLNELKEIDLVGIDLEKNLETLTLKKPNQVYFELYKEARNKAKLAKKSAIIAYLEAKNIKKTYMIETLNDSDSDFDAEIDDVSESELDRL